MAERVKHYWVLQSGGHEYICGPRGDKPTSMLMRHNANCFDCGSTIGCGWCMTGPALAEKLDDIWRRTTFTAEVVVEERSV